MDVRIKMDSNYKNFMYFLIAISFPISILLKKFTRNISSVTSNHSKFFRFPYDLQTKERKALLPHVWICSVHYPLVLNPTVNIIELGRINTPMRATT